jgi:hypothetical protein
MDGVPEVQTDDSRTYADAFSEASVDDGKGAAGIGDPGQPPTGDQPVVNQGEPSEKPEEGAAAEPGQPAEQPPQAQAPPTQQPIDPSKLDPVMLYNQMQQDRALMVQRFQTLQGMFRAEKEAWEKEKAELVQSRTAPAPAADDLSELTDEEKQAIQDYELEFDTISKAEAIKRKALVAQLKKEMQGNFDLFKGALMEIAETLRSTTDQSHFGSIRDAHPDFENLRDSGEIVKWIESQPRYLQPGLVAVYKEGQASDVIDLIGRFKKETGLVKNTTPNAPRPNPNRDDLNKRIQNLTVVSDKRIPVSTDAKPGADSFEDAFKEASASGIGSR